MIFSSSFFYITWTWRWKWKKHRGKHCLRKKIYKKDLFLVYFFMCMPDKKVRQKIWSDKNSLCIFCVFLFLFILFFCVYTIGRFKVEFFCRCCVVIWFLLSKNFDGTILQASVWLLKLSFDMCLCVLCHDYTLNKLFYSWLVFFSLDFLHVLFHTIKKKIQKNVENKKCGWGSMLNMVARILH